MNQVCSIENNIGSHLKKANVGIRLMVNVFPPNDTPLRIDTSGWGVDFGALFHQIWIRYL